MTPRGYSEAEHEYEERDIDDEQEIRTLFYREQDGESDSGDFGSDAERMDHKRGFTKDYRVEPNALQLTPNNAAQE